MDQVTVQFHRQVIRLLRGVLSAWEDWLKAKAE